MQEGVEVDNPEGWPLGHQLQEPAEPTTIELRRVGDDRPTREKRGEAPGDADCRLGDRERLAADSMHGGALG